MILVVHIQNNFNNFFIYFSTITKQIIQLILTMFVGTDVCVRVVVVWEETGVPSLLYEAVVVC